VLCRVCFNYQLKHPMLIMFHVSVSFKLIRYLCPPSHSLFVSNRGHNFCYAVCLVSETFCLRSHLSIYNIFLCLLLFLFIYLTIYLSIYYQCININYIYVCLSLYLSGHLHCLLLFLKVHKYLSTPFECVFRCIIYVYLLLFSLC